MRFQIWERPIKAIGFYRYMSPICSISIAVQSILSRSCQQAASLLPTLRHRPRLLKIDRRCFWHEAMLAIFLSLGYFPALSPAAEAVGISYAL